MLGLSRSIEAKLSLESVPAQSRVQNDDEDEPRFLASRYHRKQNWQIFSGKPWMAEASLIES